VCRLAVLSQRAGLAAQDVGDVRWHSGCFLGAHELRDTLAQRFEPVIEAISEAGGDLVHVLEEKTPETKK